MQQLLLINALAVGSAYALVALGLVLVYRSTGIINFSQAGIVMLGAYAYWQAIAHGVGVGGELLTVVILGVLLGIVLWFVLHEVLRSAGELTRVIATVAIWIIMEAAVGLHFGTTPFTTPGWIVGRQYTSVLGVSIPESYLPIFASVVVLTAAVYVILHRTTIGKAMRAVADDPKSSLVTGLPVKRILLLSWIGSSVVAAFAGLLLAPIAGLSPTMGDSVFFSASFAAILGGLSSVPGALIGGLSVGLVEIYADFYIGGAYEQFTMVGVLLVALTVRPGGLLGAKRVREG